MHGATSSDLPLPPPTDIVLENTIPIRSPTPTHPVLFNCHLIRIANHHGRSGIATGALSSVSLDVDIDAASIHVLPTNSISSPLSLSGRSFVLIARVGRGGDEDGMGTDDSHLELEGA